MMGKSMSLTMQKLSKHSETFFHFERLLIGYKSKFKDRLSISILGSISQPYIQYWKKIIDMKIKK